MDKEFDLNDLVVEHDKNYYMGTLDDNFDIDKKTDNLVYCFKFYFKDGTYKYSGVKAKDPLSLYHAFEGFIDYEKFLTITEVKLSLSQILQLAKDIFPKSNIYKDICKIEIVNILTNDILGVINI